MRYDWKGIFLLRDGKAGRRRIRTIQADKWRMGINHGRHCVNGTRDEPSINPDARFFQESASARLLFRHGCIVLYMWKLHRLQSHSLERLASRILLRTSLDMIGWKRGRDKKHFPPPCAIRLARSRVKTALFFPKFFRRNSVIEFPLD